MKTFLLAFFVVLFMCFSVNIAQAEEETLIFTWDQVIPPDFAGWHIYQSEDSQQYGTEPIINIPYEGTDSRSYTATETITSPDKEEHLYYFVLTAYDKAGNESDYSNEVSVTIDFDAPGESFNLTISIVAR